MRNAHLRDIAKVIRSKNSGPFEITFDVSFDDIDAYHRVKASGVMDQARMEHPYGVPEGDVVACMSLDPTMAFEMTLRRRWAQGSGCERDTIGAEQHAPFLEIVAPCLRIGARGDPRSA